MRIFQIISPLGTIDLLGQGDTGYTVGPFADGIPTNITEATPPSFLGGSRNQGRVLENVNVTLPITVKGSSVTDLADRLNLLQRHLDLCFDHQDYPELFGPVYFKQQFDNEPTPRYCMIRGWDGQPTDTWTQLLLAGGAHEVTFSITRDPTWRSTVPGGEPDLIVAETTIDNTSDSVAADAPKVNYVSFGAAVIKGSLPAPLRLLVRGVSITGVGWFRVLYGFRSIGTVANFIHMYECESGTLTNGTSSVVAAGTNGDAVAQVNFNTGGASNQKRVSIAKSTNLADQRGRFLVLLRARNNSANNTIKAQIKYGPGGTIANRAVDCSHDDGNYRIYELGIIQYPAAGLDTGYEESQITMELWVESSGASNTFNMDCIYLMPVSECFGAVHLSDIIKTYTVRIDGTPEVPTICVMNGTDCTVNNNIDKLNTFRGRLPEMRPFRAGRLYVLTTSQNTYTHHRTSRVGITLSGYWRYPLLRGTT